MPQYNGRMVKAGPLGPFHPSVAEITTTDVRKFLAWVDRMVGLGYVEQVDHEETLNMLRALARKRDAELSKPFEPTAQDVADMRAHKASGKDQKPFPKRTMERDKRVATPWEQVRPPGPKTPQRSTKRFPHLGGQTGPQARGE